MEHTTPLRRRNEEDTFNEHVAYINIPDVNIERLTEMVQQLNEAQRDESFGLG